MVRHRWPLYVCYAVPGTFLAIRLELSFSQARPIWLFPAQVAVIALPLLVSAYVCGRRGWKCTLLLGSVVNYAASWLCLAMADETGRPDSFYFQLLTGFFFIGLIAQWICYLLGKEVRKNADGNGGA